MSEGAEAAEAAVMNYRRRRMASLEHALTDEFDEWKATRGLPDNVRFSLAFAVVALARENLDKSVVSATIRGWADSEPVADAAWAHVLSQASDGIPLEAAAADDGLWAPTGDSMTSATPLSPVASQASWLVRDAGFRHVAMAGPGSVTLVRSRNVGESTRSWTVSSLPGSIFVDFSPSAPRFAEDLLHESAHAFLNDLMRAEEMRIGLEPEFMSPWKGVRRSAFGMLHSGFAFGAVVKYCEWALENSTELGLDQAHINYFASRSESERERAGEVRSIFKELQDRITSPIVAGVFAEHLAHLSRDN